MHLTTTPLKLHTLTLIALVLLLLLLLTPPSHAFIPTDPEFQVPIDSTPIRQGDNTQRGGVDGYDVAMTMPTMTAAEAKSGAGRAGPVVMGVGSVVVVVVMGGVVGGWVV
ncbi:hypothetical protein HDU96_007815 [Phlyctochytrium bullatum]|nr:hypothetical protein HDU96_007815 [Phlyctochytrium bullatum]